MPIGRRRRVGGRSRPTRPSRLALLALQTMTEMLGKDFVASSPGGDARERIISFTPAGQALLPALDAVWEAVRAAVDELSDDIRQPLAQVLQRAIAAVDDRSFRERILGKIGKAAPARR